MADRRPRRSSTGRDEKPKTPRPRKKPANAKAARRPASKRKPPKRKGNKSGIDPSGIWDAETRFVQPYQATKTYLCPGCMRDIPPGMGHIVAMPPDEADLRRHWHRGCWENRHNLR